MDREWETIQNYNIGLDFGLFGNRLKGTAELFWKVCENMLIDVSYPATLGDKAPTANVGSFKANGFEGNLNWSDKIGKVGYSIGGTFTYTTNKLTDNGGSATITDGVRSDREGYPLNSVFGLKYVGKSRMKSSWRNTFTAIPVIIQSICLPTCVWAIICMKM